MRNISEEIQFIYKENMEEIKKTVALQAESNLKITGKEYTDEARIKYIEMLAHAHITNKAVMGKIDEIVAWINKHEDEGSLG